MNNEARYYKSEYERLRRKKNKEIERMKRQQLQFFLSTYKLLKLLGWKDEQIIRYYESEKEIQSL